MRRQQASNPRQRRISVPAFIILGFAFGLLFPLLGSISEVLILGLSPNYEHILEQWLTIPRAMRIGGPFILAALLGFLGRVLRRRQQEQARYQTELLAYAQELEIQNERLANLNRALDGLVYTASHDLKTPVVNFEGMIHILREILAQDPNSPLIGNIFSRMDDAVDRFKDTIDGLMAISQLENELEKNRASVEVAIALNNALANLELDQKPSKEQLELEFSPGLKVQMPPDFMERIFQNLLSNAVRFAHADVPLRISIRSSEQDGLVCIAFKDNGSGMDLKGNEDKPFQMFTRMHKSGKGKGIGLYVVKRMVDGSGGKIKVESQIGKGTIFRLYLPRS